MRVLLSGYRGRMGQKTAALCRAGYRNAVLFAMVDKGFAGTEENGEGCFSAFGQVPCGAEVIVDFSHHTQTRALLSYALSCGIPAVIGTTGQNEAEKQLIREAAGHIPIFFAANLSYGLAVMTELLLVAAKAFPKAEIEIVERHHKNKIDAPSGTAFALFEALAGERPKAYPVMGRSGHAVRDPEEIGIHALRLGGIFGEHEVLFADECEVLSLKHTVNDGSVFARGALDAAAFLSGRAPGLYDMRALLRAEGRRES